MDQKDLEALGDTLGVLIQEVAALKDAMGFMCGTLAAISPVAAEELAQRLESLTKPHAGFEVSPSLVTIADILVRWLRDGDIPVLSVKEESRRPVDRARLRSLLTLVQGGAPGPSGRTPEAP
jgi:hypothetical protein